MTPLKTNHRSPFLGKNTDLTSVNNFLRHNPSGASEAINLMLQAFCEPFKDQICVTPPTFGLYEELAVRHQVEAKTSPLLGQYFDQLNFETLKDSNAKIIYLCSPNNPVGTELKFNEIRHLLTHISDAIIVIDETYVEFSFNQKCLALLSEYENLVFIRSFSKAWGLAGVRAGAVIANKSIIDVLRLIQLPFTFSEPAQESVSKRFGQTSDINKLVDEFTYLRNMLSSFLIGLDDVEMVYPSSTNFITACFRHHDVYFKLFTREKILATLMHEALPKAIRLSIYDKNHVEKLISIIQLMNNMKTYV